MMMTEELFKDVYTRFKLHFYQEIFSNFGTREATLTTVETFCMEVIYAMNHPTINEFASFIRISSPNAAYKINNLIKKGYLKKIQSQKDKREYFLEVTQKYVDYYNISTSYMAKVLARVREKMSNEEWDAFYHSLEIISKEQEKEIPDFRSNQRFIEEA